MRIVLEKILRFQADTGSAAWGAHHKVGSWASKGHNELWDANGLKP